VKREGNPSDKQRTSIDLTCMSASIRNRFSLVLVAGSGWPGIYSGISTTRLPKCWNGPWLTYQCIGHRDPAALQHAERRWAAPDALLGIPPAVQLQELHLQFSKNQRKVRKASVKSLESTSREAGRHRARSLSGRAAVDEPQVVSACELGKGREPLQSSQLTCL